MMRLALIESGRIANIATGDAAWAASAPGEWVAAGDDWQIGEPWDAAAAAPLRVTPSRAERAAAITLTPAVFYPALRAAVGFGTATPPAPTTPTRDWLLAFLAGVHAEPAGLAAAMGVDAATAQGAITLMIDRMAGATAIERADAGMDIFGGLLGLSPDQIDRVFIAAAQAAADLEIPARVAAALAAE